jgi:alkylation response protein AidB-like acyl-CoA dehydrogenase
MFECNPDQELLQDTTRRFLKSRCPSSTIRSLTGSKSGFESDFWRRGAEYGWTSLVVPEEYGGGSISAEGVVDLVLIAYEFGRHAAPGPLAPTNLVAAAIARWGSDQQRSTLLQALVSGETTAAWAREEPAPGDALGRVSLEAFRDGSEVVLSGRKGPVEAGAEASHLLVVARERDGLSQLLVPVDAPGLVVTPLRGLDLTRRYAQLELNGVRLPESARVGDAAEAADAVGWLGDLAVLIQTAEMVGCMQWALDTTLEWAFNRYSFGRPLATYQEIKHRFADMKMWLEGSYAIVADAAKSVEHDRADRPEKISAAKYYVGRYGAELLQDCVQLHGGIGVTCEHDLHLFLRRVTTSLPVHGSPTEHAVRLGRLLSATVAREAAQV